MPKEKINHAPTLIQCDPAEGGVLPATISEIAWKPVPEGESPGAWADGVTRRDAEVCVGWHRDSWVQLSIEAEPSYFAMAAEFKDGEGGRTSVYTPPLNRDEINKLIRALRRARDQVFGQDE